MHRFASTICIFSLAGTAAAQETFIVPDDIATLEDALDPAVSGIDPGDIIILRDTFTHTGTFLVDIADLTIRAADGDTPVLDANGGGSVIRVEVEDGDITLEGLTIQDGSGVGNNQRGSGVDVLSADRVTILDCIIQNNDADNANGGAVGGENFTLVMGGCELIGNEGRDGGAIFQNGSGDLQLVGTNLRENVANRDGGGIVWNSNGSGRLNLQNVGFLDNAANDRGGALILRNIESARLRNARFFDNTAIGENGSDGGAMFVNVADRLTFENCRFRRNLANGAGGAILTFLNTGAGDSAEYIDCEFTDNESSSSTIGAFGGFNDFINCTFNTNTSLRPGDGGGDGGAIRFRTTQGGQRAFGQVFNCVFDGNLADRGGAIAIGTANVDIANSTFVNNSAGVGAGVAGLASGGNITVSNNIFATNGGDAVDLSAVGGVDSIAFNLFDTAEPTEGTLDDNISNADPQFTDASAGDYSLLAGSPAIDAGNSDLYGFGPFVDLAGNPRGQDDLDTADTGAARIGPVVDMGAFEFDVTETGGDDPCPVDANGDGVIDFNDVLTVLAGFGSVCP
ncbi:MAG: choice-of-anchor Q domain-containing protein [Phycisphaerales bacterium]